MRKVCLHTIVCMSAVALLLLPNFFPLHLIPLEKEGNPGEKFSPKLAIEINTIDELVIAADAHAVVNNLPINSVAYWDNMSTIIKNIFYHGYSHYSLSENWIAAVAGKLCWKDLSALVDPDEIIGQPMAACSQQSIVLMDCFRKKGILYRPVTFGNHYAVEAYIANHWRYFDTNLEPTFPNNSHLASFTEYALNGSLASMYKNIIPDAEIANFRTHPHFGKICASPAPRALIFQKVTSIASKTLWLIPFTILISSYRRNKYLMKRLSSSSRLAYA